MNSAATKVLSYLTGKENIDDVPVSALQKLVDEDPYFPVAQFLLAKKLKATGDPAFETQVQKTALYFSNPLWTDFNIHDPGVTSTEVTDYSLDESQYDSAINHPLVEQQKDAAGSVEEAPPGTNLFKSRELAAASELAHHTLQEVPEESSPAIQEEITPVFQPEEEAAAMSRDTDTSTEIILDRLDATVETGLHADLEETVTETEIPTSEEVVEVGEEMAGATHDIDRTTEAFLQEPEQPAEDKPIGPVITPEIIEDKVAHVPEVLEAYHKEHPEEQDEHERMFQNIKAMLDFAGEEANAETGDSLVPIDPYYTIDYFASQGIKLDFEQNPQDQLGKNLKKFTQWLKHMKKLGPEDAIETLNRNEADAEVQQIADSSNVIKEVVTEAMAAVLEKQGKKAKAIELYNKLSFLNPDKKTYFAGKIKNLKGN